MPTSPTTAELQAAAVRIAKQHGHSCPAGRIFDSQTITLGDGKIIQLGVCTCGEVIARRYVITGPGTGPWTILPPEEK
jgi:hypothetical protein